MVVGLALAAVQMGMALPTGFLFGVGYGTGVRIGYEQVYPLLFPKGARSTTTELAATMKGMNTVYDAIGGKDASRMGIAVGITNAGEILNNPDFRVLEQLESSSSGLTSLNSTPLDLDGNLLSPQPAPSFSSKPQQGDIFFNQPTLTLSNKEFLIKQIQVSTDVVYLARIRNQYTDPNLIQIIEARIRQLRNPTTTPKIVNTVPTAPPAPKREATTQESDYNIWQSELASLQIEHQKWWKWMQNHAVTSTASANVYKKRIAELSSAIRKISQDYRNPNNTIRTHVLRLRQEIANGNWLTWK